MNRAIKRAAQLGHRAAAQDNDPKNPYDFLKQVPEHDAWVDAVARVQEHRKNGLDPAGHHAPIPRLCTRDVTKVCNCCSDCQAVCFVEGIAEKGRGLLRKVFG